MYINFVLQIILFNILTLLLKDVNIIYLVYCFINCFFIRVSLKRFKNLFQLYQLHYKTIIKFKSFV